MEVAAIPAILLVVFDRVNVRALAKLAEKITNGLQHDMC
jgi:hypothetical protein